MGYITSWNGYFNISPELSGEAKVILEYRLKEDKLDGWTSWYIPGPPYSNLWPEEGKCYHWEPWLRATVKHLANLGHEVTGYVEWQGEDFKDCGKVGIENNAISIYDYQRVPVLRA